MPNFCFQLRWLGVGMGFKIGRGWFKAGLTFKDLANTNLWVEPAIMGILD
jgi:hypothetical protein